MDKLSVFNGLLILFFILSFVVLIAMGRMLRTSMFLKKQLPLAVCFIMGTVMIVQFFVPQENPWNKSLGELPIKWLQIVSAFALAIGLISLISINFTKIARKQEDWQYSILLLTGFIATAFFGLTGGMQDEKFDFIFKYMYTPMQSTMFSILAFFVASAAFRAFRAKSKEATLLLAAAILVMLGRVQLGSDLWGKIPFIGTHTDISEITIWINDVITTAGQRAILLGASLGYIAASFKILLGIERSYFGGEE